MANFHSFKLDSSNTLLSAVKGAKLNAICYPPGWYSKVQVSRKFDISDIISAFKKAQSKNLIYPVTFSPKNIAGRKYGLIPRKF